MPIELPVLVVGDAAAWVTWLVRNSESSKGVWLTLAKKGTTRPTSLTYAQALDGALCYGWIDGQTKKFDELTYGQRFTPRGPKSIWSQRNVVNVARLESEGRMTQLGRSAVEAAKADGRWEAAYAGQATAEAPEDFLAAVALVPKAQAMWEDLSKQNRFAIYFRLKALKTQAGREKRISAFVDMLARGETPHPQKTTQKTPKALEPASKQRTAPAPKPTKVRKSTRRQQPTRKSARLHNTDPTDNN